jgi:hypothetical protein
MMKMNRSCKRCGKPLFTGEYYCSCKDDEFTVMEEKEEIISKPKPDHLTPRCYMCGSVMELVCEREITGEEACIAVDFECTKDGCHCEMTYYCPDEDEKDVTD